MIIIGLGAFGCLADESKNEILTKVALHTGDTLCERQNAAPPD